MNLCNLPLFKRVYYWNVLPKNNLYPSDCREKNFKLFREALVTLNLVLMIAFISALVGNFTVCYFYSFKVVCSVLFVDTLIIAIILLKRKRLQDMCDDYDYDRRKMDCF
jgi:hypothetical protein